MQAGTNQLIRSECTAPSIRCDGVDEMLRRITVPVFFFYPRRLDLKVLTRSLTETLCDFPIFAGRLRVDRNGMSIECSDAGVALSVVERRERVGVFLRALPESEHKLVQHIDAAAALRGKAPLLTVRFTHFEDGTALGITWHHSVGDLATFMAFMNAWSQRVAGDDPKRPTVPTDRFAYIQKHAPRTDTESDTLRYLKTHELIYSLGYLAFEAPRKQHVFFYFTPTEIAQLRQALQYEASCPLTTSDVLSGYMAAKVADLDPRRRQRQVSIAINWRARLGLPSDLLGNVLGALLVDCEPQPRAAVLASRIHEAVQASVTNHFDYFSSHRFYYRHGGMRRSWRIVPRGIDPIRGTINISNWCRFGVYDILFEGTSPSLFMIIDSLPIPWMAAIIEGPGGQGHLFSAVLPRAIVRALTRPEQLRDLHQYRPADDSHAKTMLQNYPFMY